MTGRRQRSGRSSSWPGPTTLATELNKKPEAVQEATLLTVIGEEARDVFSTFTDWSEADNDKKIEPVLAKFSHYCQPRRNIPFERYRWLVFGTKDSKVRERLLREANLTLQKTEELCSAAESMLAQMKVVSDNAETTVSVVNVKQDHQGPPDKAMATSKSTLECENCGRKHEQHKRELCPCYGKVCNNCL